MQQPSPFNYLTLVMKDNTGEISLMIQLMSNEDEKLETLLKELGTLSNEKEVAQRNNINNLFTQIHERNQTDTTTLSVSLAETSSETKDLTLDSVKYTSLKIKADTTFTNETINTYDVFVRQKFIEGEEYQELLFGNWEADYKETELPEDNYKFSIFVSMEQETNLRTYLGVNTIASLDPKPEIAIKADLLTSVFSMKDPKRAKEVAAAINKYSDQYGINTKAKMANLIGQLGFESGGFKKLKENSNYDAKAIYKIFLKPSRTEKDDNKTKLTHKTYKYIDLIEGYNGNTTTCPTYKGPKMTSTYPKYKYSYDESLGTSEAERRKKNYDAWMKKTKLKVKSSYEQTSSLFDYTYSCRMDNGAKSTKDGSLYKGVGFVHLTGKRNNNFYYEKWKAADSLNRDTVSIESFAQKMVTDYDVAMEVALLFWNEGELNDPEKGIQGNPTWESDTTLFKDNARKAGGAINAGNITKKEKQIHDFNKRLEKTKQIHKKL